MNNLEEAAENFRVIYNKAWALFSGVKPMTREEALEMVREMKPIIDRGSSSSPISTRSRSGSSSPCRT